MSMNDLVKRITNRSTPVVAKGEEQALVTSATLAASGAYTASGIVDLGDARRVSLCLRYAAASAAGYPHVIPLFAATLASPLVTDDSWYAAGGLDGNLFTDALLAGAMPTNHDITIAPEWTIGTYRPSVIRMESGDATTDRIREFVTLDATPWRWMFLLYAEVGKTANPGTFAASYVLSI